MIHVVPVMGLVVTAIATFTVALAAPDPCKLVSQGEAGNAMGESAKPAIRSTFHNNPSCRYYNASKTKNVFLVNVGSAEFARAKQFRGSPMPVPGVGDEAFWKFGSLFVRRGANYEQVGLYLNGNSMKQMEPGVQALGKLAAGRM